MGDGKRGEKISNINSKKQDRVRMSWPFGGDRSVDNPWPR